MSAARADLVICSATIHHAKDRLRRFDNLEAALSRKLKIEQARRSRFNAGRVIMLRQALARLDVLMPFYRGRSLP